MLSASEKSCGRKFMTRKTKLGLALCGIVMGFFTYRKRWNIAHNGIAHPLYIFAENSEWVDRLHEWSGKKWEKGSAKTFGIE
jgi:hypothetical protein